MCTLFANLYMLLTWGPHMVYHGDTIYILHLCIKKGKVFNGQEPPIGESTAAECEVNYQLLAVIY